MARAVLPAVLRAGLLVAALWFAAPSAFAVFAEPPLADPAAEARARHIMAGLRCLVCQNESIDSSNADLARELRLLVRERLVAGDSDRQVLDFLVKRYGDFVLLRPPFKPSTYILWFGPVLVLLVGGGALLYAVRRRRARPAAEAPPLTAEEAARLDRLLAESEADGGPGQGRAS